MRSVFKFTFASNFWRSPVWASFCSIVRLRPMSDSESFVLLSDTLFTSSITFPLPPSVCTSTCALRFDSISFSWSPINCNTSFTIAFCLLYTCKVSSKERFGALPHHARVIATTETKLKTPTFFNCIFHTMKN